MSMTKSSRPKKLLVAIESIAQEEGQLVINCQLQTSQATVSFTFNCSSDSAEEIISNLVGSGCVPVTGSGRV